MSAGMCWYAVVRLAAFGKEFGKRWKQAAEEVRNERLAREAAGSGSTLKRAEAVRSVGLIKQGERK